MIDSQKPDGAGVAPAPLPLTLEQLVTHRRPSEPSLTPDGSMVAFTVRPMSKEGEHEQSAIWVVGFADGEPRQFTSGLTKDCSPAWSPNGDRLAFVSDRAERGKQSIYVMPSSGGEALRVFDQQGTAARPRWSPDGRVLGFLFTPEETEEEKQRKEKREDAKVWDGDPKYRRLWIVNPGRAGATAMSPPDRQVHEFAWSADGKRVAICTTPTPRIDDIFLECDVSVIDLDSGNSVAALATRGLAADLVWSPDGTRLAWRGPADRVVHGEYVWVRDVAGGEPVCLTSGYGGTAAYLTACNGGSTLILQATEGVNSALYRLDWSGKRERLLSSEPWGAFESNVSVSADGSRAAGVWEDGTHAPDIWVATTAGHAPEATLRRRTRLNPELETAALGQTEIVRWESDPGVEVEGVLVKPTGYDPRQRYPLVVQVHGGPTSAWPNMFYASWHDWAQFLAGRGYAVLMPNPRGSTGRGPDWANAIFNDVGGGEYRDMMTGVDAMIERGIADPDALGIGGWSWGGYMTAWTVSQTRRFKAAVMGAGLPNMISDNSIGDIPSVNLSYFDQSPYHDSEPYYERSAIRHIRNATTPTLILHGEADQRVNMWQGVEMYVALRTLGVETQLVTYPREPHGIMERHHQLDLLQRVLGWFDTHLQPERPRDEVPKE